MSTTLTPPPSGSATPPAEKPPRRNGTSFTVAIVAAVIGSLVLIGTAGGAVISTVSGALRSDEIRSLDVTGITAVDIDASAGSVELVFAEVQEAVLEVQDSGEGAWRLERDGDTLKVANPDGLFRWSWFDGDSRVTLTLPIELQDAGLDARVDLSSGSFTAVGGFGALELGIDSGALTLSGSADTLILDVNAGRADVELEDVSEAEITVAAGRVVADLTGAAPDSVDLDVSAGSLEMTLPDTSYDVRSDVSAGSFDNGLEVSSSSPREVTVSVSAGRAALRSAS